MRPDIDPALNYCSRCCEEYRADIRTCSACTIELVSGEALLAQAGGHNGPSPLPRPAILPGETLVTIRKGPILQIKQIQHALSKRGLPALTAKEDGGSCGCRGPEVELRVRENDLAEAMRVLAEEYWQSTGLAEHDLQFAGAVFDAEAAEAICPACGCRFATDSTTCPDCGLCFA